MPDSLIGNIDRRTGRPVPAAPRDGIVLSSAPLGWRGIAVELHRIAPEHQPEHVVQTHRLMIHVGSPARFEFRDGGGAWQACQLRPGALSLLAHGEVNEPRWHDPMEFLAIGLEPAFVAAGFGDALPGGVVRLPRVRGEIDPVAARLSAMLRRELAETSFFGSLFGETAALAFARHLLGHYGIGVREPRGALSGAQLMRVTEFLHANIAEDVGLAMLAEQAHVSPFHFARLFRLATGRSPYQFLLHLRVAHAQQLIRARCTRTLTEVSAAAGFFDQAHFTRTFRRVVGTTPSGFASASGA